MKRIKHLFLFLFVNIVNSKYPCFEENSTQSPDSYLPWEDITFNLFTRSNLHYPQIISYGDNFTLTSSNFQWNKPTKILLHGRVGNLNDTFNTIVIKAILDQYDVNVVSFDWSCGANGDYDNVVELVPLAGNVVAKYMDWLMSFGVKSSDIQIIGFSQGGQMAGIVGRKMKTKPSHITSLDPAGPIWINSNNSITKNDAKFVDIIHTSTHTVGMEKASGHCDFYPNKGFSMPGCINEETSCSHLRAVYYFAESLSGTKFSSNYCKSYEDMLTENFDSSKTSNMGGLFVKNCSGIYYLTTNTDEPFSQN